jgi:hypothetical protein
VRGCGRVWRGTLSEEWTHWLHHHRTGKVSTTSHQKCCVALIAGASLSEAEPLPALNSPRQGLHQQGCYISLETYQISADIGLIRCISSQLIWYQQGQAPEKGPFALGLSFEGWWTTSPPRGIKSPFPDLLMCTGARRIPARRIPAICSTNQGD